MAVVRKEVGDTVRAVVLVAMGEVVAVIIVKKTHSRRIEEARETRY